MITLEELRADCCAYPIPSYDSPEQAMRYIERNHRAIFEWELFGWYTDESTWPKKLTLSIFRKWFDVEIHTMTVDMPNKHIAREKIDE